MSQRLALPNRRKHITQKVRIPSKRTLYISVHDDDQPAEIFLRVKGSECSSELIGLYNVVARLMSLTQQCPVKQDGNRLAGAKFAPCGPIIGHNPNLLGRHSLMEYRRRNALTCGLRISGDPTIDNLTPEETTNQDTPEVAACGASLSCPGSSGVADADDESRK